jgi:hypothetical protein
MDLLARTGQTIGCFGADLARMRGGSFWQGKNLIRQGANVNARGDSGETPLHQAKSRQAAELLISKGADIEAKDTDFEWQKSIPHSKTAIARRRPLRKSTG